MVGGNKSEGIMHVDCWTLPLKALLNSSKGAGGISGTSPPAWERITRKGEYPSARAGTSAIIYKNKLLVFGGVLDSEGDHHRMESVFYDDLFALDMERKRWFAMRLKKASGGGGRRRKKKKDDEENDGESDNDDEVDDEESGEAKNVEAVSSGWDVEKLKHDMFAFIDGDGNIVYERIEDESGDENDKKSERNEETENKVPGGEPVDSSVSTKDLDSSSHGGDSANQCRKEEKENDSSNTKTSGKIAASSVMKVNAMGLPMAAARKTPLPRINCATVIRGNTLYIYGGVLEVGDREVTLDDCWSIDLVKRDKWSCIWPGQMHRQVWKGVDSDNESYISTDRGGDDDSDDEEDDEYMSEFAPMEENDEKDDDDSEKARRKAKKAAKKEKEKEKRRGIRHEMQELKDKLGIDNDQRTPLMGESVADFYARTTEYWNMEAAKTVGQVAADSGDSMSAKELKREGFQLAKHRYDELKPVLDRLNELEAMQHEAEEEKKAKKSSKGEKERKKDRR